MLIAHMSDLHIGHRQYRIEERELDIYEHLYSIIENLKTDKPDIIIISGDFFDSPRPSIRALKEGIEFIKKLHELGLKVFMVLGDHDTPKLRDLPPQALIRYAKVLGTKAENLHLTINVGGKEWLLAGISYKPFGSRYKKLLHEYLGRLGILINNHKKSNILIMHQAIEEFFRFQPHLSLSELPENVFYVAMGHLHMRIVHRLPKGGLLAYSGSLDIFRVDEIEEWKRNGKGYYLVDLSGDEPIINKINIEIRPQEIFEGDYETVKKSIEYYLRSVKSTKKPIIHVRVYEPWGLRGDLASKLHSIFSNRCYLRVRSISLPKDEDIGRALRPEEVDEVSILERIIGSKTIAKSIIELKDALVGKSSRSIDELINEITDERKLWEKKLVRVIT